MTDRDTNFAERLAWSRGQAGQTDADTIQKLLPGCVCVEQASTALDKKGVDFVARLRRGAEVFIDTKRRQVGAARYWRSFPLLGFDSPEPELAIEIWSRVPNNGRSGAVGWTLDESKITDYVLYLFDPLDSHEAFLLPFQLLRVATVRNLSGWSQQWKNATQTSNGGAGNGGWNSGSLFVPGWCVIEAINAEMRLNLGALMPELPYMQWYCNDWIGDPMVTALTPQTRAIWFDWLNVMHLTGRTGILVGTIGQLSRWGRCDTSQAQAAIYEIALIETDLATDEAGTYTIRNRRMMREHAERKAARNRQLARRERIGNDSVTPLSRDKNAPRVYGVGVGYSSGNNDEGGCKGETSPEADQTPPLDLEEIGDWLARVPKVSGSEKLRDAIVRYGHTADSLKALWANVVSTPKVRDRKAFFVSQIQGGAKAVSA